MHTPLILVVFVKTIGPLQLTLKCTEPRVTKSTCFPECKIKKCLIMDTYKNCF